MSDTRARLVEAFTVILAEATAKLPEAMFFNVPVGRLADAALDVFGDVPRPPAYDPEVTPEREFYGVLTQDAATAGHTNDRARVEPSGSDYGVTLHMLDGRTGAEGEVRLPRQDAEQLFLVGLSIVAFQDAEERREAKGE